MEYFAGLTLVLKLPGRWLSFWHNGLSFVMIWCGLACNGIISQANGYAPLAPAPQIHLAWQSTLIRLVARVAARLASLLWHIVSHSEAAPTTGNRQSCTGNKNV